MYTLSNYGKGDNCEGYEIFQYCLREKNNDFVVYE